MNNRSMRRRGWAALALLGAGALVAGGCSTDRLLQVKDPAIATPGSLATKDALPTLYAGAIGDFQVAYSGSSDGNNEGYLLVSAVMTDEFRDADTYPTRIATDQRAQQPVNMGNTSDAAFTMLQRARHSSATAADAIAGAADLKDRDPRIATLRSLEGLTYVALGEGFCGYIPFSDVVGGVQQPGTPLTQAQVWDEAVKRFDDALAVDPSFDLARVAKGRALLDKGDYAGAAAAVANVPTSFVWFVEHSENSGRQNNPVYTIASSNGRYSVADTEGVNGMPFRSAGDPRVVWTDKGGNGFDGTTRMFLDLRYPTYSSNAAVATGVEARLIEAEAALKTGDVPGWLGKLNDLRANVGSLMVGMVPDYANQIKKNGAIATALAPLTDPGSQAARENLMFSERAFWLYTTGHRLGDLRRLVRQYGRTQDQVFPSGAYFKGNDYGADVAFPIPFNEIQNTNYTPNQCDVKKA